MLFVMVAVAMAATKVESIGTLDKGPATVKAAVEAKGYRVYGDNGKVLAEVWPAKDATAGKNPSDAALYANLTPGTFAGVLSFPAGGQDYRGQNIPAGVYTMRYELLPSDGNHMGVAPNPDFFLLVPIDEDTNPAQQLAFADLVKLSKTAAKTNHPAVFQLNEPGSAVPGAAVDDNGFTVFTFNLTIGGKPTPVGMIVNGSAE